MKKYIIGFIFLLQAILVTAQQRPLVSAINYLNLVGAYGNAGQVLIAEGDKIILNKSYGYAIRNEFIPVSNETIFELASTSKMFTAIAVLKLEMLSKLSVTDTLGKFFPSAPADKKAITLHQLLSHTSGIPGGDLIDDFQPVSKDDLVKKVLATGLRAAPGQKFIYSNAGYNLLAAIIEKVSGKEYGDFLYEIIFKPFRMQHSSVNGSAFLRNKKVAHGYQGILDTGGPDRPIFNARTWGGGSVCSTVSDLWLLKKAFDGNVLLDKKEKDKMFTVQVKIADDNNYGYGCFVYTSNGKKIIDFIGETERGFNCTFRNFVDEKKTFISISSGSQPNERHNRWFIDAHLKNLWQESKHFEFPPPVKQLPGSALKEYEGVYLSGDASLTIHAEGNNLIAEVNGISASNLLYHFDEGQIKKTAAVTQAISSLMNSYLTKTNDGFKNILAAESIPDFAAERDKLLTTNGPLKNFHIKGILPDRDPNFMSAALLLEFDDKKIPFFTLWNAEDTSHVTLDYSEAGLPTTIGGIFSCTGKDKFISYDFFKDKIITTIEFERGNHKIKAIRSGDLVFYKK